MSEVIYVLKDNVTNNPIYVGRTGNPRQRLDSHKQILGPAITLHIIQDEFRDGETASEAEFKWIAHYSQINPRLLNQTGIPHKKPRKAYAFEEMEIGSCELLKDLPESVISPPDWECAPGPDGMTKADWNKFVWRNKGRVTNLKPKQGIKCKNGFTRLQQRRIMKRRHGAMADVARKLGLSSHHLLFWFRGIDAPFLKSDRIEQMVAERVAEILTQKQESKAQAAELDKIWREHLAFKKEMATHVS
jgi:hypothetical protein